MKNKEEFEAKKKVKAIYKAESKVNSSVFRQARMNIIDAIVHSATPNWGGIKLTVLY
jgi:hypothetical protein